MRLPAAGDCSPKDKEIEKDLGSKAIRRQRSVKLPANAREKFRIGSGSLMQAIRIIDAGYYWEKWPCT
jgi:hypothetical protein